MIDQEFLKTDDEIFCYNNHDVDKKDVKEEWKGMLICPYCWPNGFMNHKIKTKKYTYRKTITVKNTKIEDLPKLNLHQDEFMQRVLSPEFQEVVKEYREEFPAGPNDWAKKNPEKHQKLVKKYSQTDKGRYANSKRNSTRRKRFEAAVENLTWEEKILIGEFYRNCPEGYEVDHIIPVSKGGTHTLSNLQYLTKDENRKKSNKLNWNKNNSWQT